MATFQRRKDDQPKGLFLNGQWLCDCDPRQPAVKFTSRKENANKGKRFYVCQKQQGDPAKCKMFLWEHQAKSREESVLLNGNGSRSESDPRVAAASLPVTPAPNRFQRQTVSPPPAYTPTATQSTSRKRTRPSVNEDDEFGDLTDDSPEMDHALAAVETPSKFARTTSATVPPRRKLPWAKDGTTHGAGDLPTPQSESRTKDFSPFKTPFDKPGSSMLTPSMYRTSDEIARAQASASNGFASSSFEAPDTPTPVRFRGAGPSKSVDRITRNIFSHLQDQNAKTMTDRTEHELRVALAKEGMREQEAERRHQGVVRGRDLLRSSLAAKDAKIRELQSRIETLEAEKAESKEMIQLLRWQKETGYSSDEEGEEL